MTNIDFNEIIINSDSVNARVESVTRVIGGDINEAYCVKTSQAKIFAKVNLLDRFPDMFRLESEGLNLLRDKSHFTIPNVIDVLAFEQHQVMLLEWIDQVQKGVGFWKHFGQSLANMHRNTAMNFGSHHDNYIGSLAQSNKETPSWGEFFVSERLDPLARKAFESGLISKSELESMEKIYTKLDHFFPYEPPALLHGDLWSGNYMVDGSGMPALIDPAVYYGHRYMDLGMMKLFGGFDRSCFDAYSEEYPLETGWEDSLNIANLYPLLVHLNLFGRSYWGQIKPILDRYIK